MGLIDKLRSITKSNVSVTETETGFEDIPQENLHGDKTLVIEVYGTVSRNSTYFLPISEGTVYVPKGWSDSRLRSVTPNDSAGLVDLLVQYGYDVDEKPIFKDRNGEYLYS